MIAAIPQQARPRPTVASALRPHRALRLLALLCALCMQVGCLRVRERFELAADLSGRVHIEAVVPSAFLPRSAATQLRLDASDLSLPDGVRLRRHEVREDARTHELHFELTLDFRALEQLAEVALRYPGSSEPPAIYPWRGLELQRTATKIEILRRAYGVGEIETTDLTTRPEGRLAASTLRWSSSFRFAPTERWIAPYGGWVSLPGSRGREWSRVRTWGDHLAGPAEPLRALLPLSFAQRLRLAATGATRGGLAALPWLGIAFWLWRAQRRRSARSDAGLRAAAAPRT